MPGCGKSIIGKKLAGILNSDFFDADKAIERDYGDSLPGILEKIGEANFLKKEEETIISKTQSKNNLVISPGGSIIYRDKAMQHLKNISVVFYLKATLPTIEKRINGVPRGIVGTKTKTIADLYTERIPLYEKWGRITINADQSVNKVIRDILKQIDPSEKSPQSAV